jgi:CheY-like chemotaxis protein
LEEALHNYSNEDRQCYAGISSLKAEINMARTMLPSPSISALDLYVLVVDDMAVIRKLYAKYVKDFEGMLFIPIECENGLAAYNTYLEKSGQVMGIVMDSNMPVMNGAESARRIRNSEMNKYNPPYIVGLSGDEPNEMFSLKAGFDEICI